MSILTPAEVEVLIAARRLAGARPHLAAVTGIVHHEELWQLCRDEPTGVVDVYIESWDIRGRWFGVAVGATPRIARTPVERHARQTGRHALSWTSTAPRKR